MDAEVQSTQPCQCELCQPNWHMGRDDDFFEPQPVVQQARQVALEEVHVRKIAKSALEFASASG